MLKSFLQQTALPTYPSRHNFLPAVTDGTDLPVTSGDAVQAAAALLMHAAGGRPLLPVAPKAMAVLVQMPAPEAYLGNGARFLPVSLPAGTAQPAAHDAPAALRALAGAIRSATAAFRTNPEEPLAAMADTEALAAAPAPRMLAFLAAERLPRLTCSVNYVPAQPKVRIQMVGVEPEQWPPIGCCLVLAGCMPSLHCSQCAEYSHSPTRTLQMDLGQGTPAVADRELTHPLARGMVVIRGAEQVGGGGAGTTNRVAG